MNSHTEDIYSNCIKIYIYEIRKLKEDLKVSKTECESQKKASVKISEELIKIKHENERYKKTNIELTKNLDHLKNIQEDIFEKSKLEMKRMNNELTSSQKEVENLKRKISELNERNRELISSREYYTIKLTESESECISLRKQLTESNTKLSSLNSELLSLKSEYNEMKESSDKLYSINQKLQSQVSFNEHRYAEQSSFIEDLKYRVISLEESINRSKQLESIVCERDSTISTLRDQLSKSENKCQSITDALQHAQEQLETSRVYDKEIETLRSQHNSLLKRAEEAEQCLRRYEEELQYKKEEYTQSMIKQSSTIEELQNQLISSHRDFDLAIERQKKSASEAEEARIFAEDLERSFNNLQRTVLRIQDKISSHNSPNPSPSKRVSFPGTSLSLSTYSDSNPQEN